MMGDYKINLFKDRVLPLRKRKSQFWSMLIYLILSGAGLAFVAHRSAVHFVAASQKYRETKAIEKQVIAGKKNATDVIQYANILRPKIIANANILTGINNSLQQNIDFVSILLGIAKPLPNGCIMTALDLQRDKNMIRFSIMTPTDKQTSHTAVELIHLWDKDGILNKHMGAIQAEASQREFRSGHAVIIHKFKADIGK